MTSYFVIGGMFVVWALVLTALGLTRPNFPPTREAGRAIVAFSAVLFAATVVILLVTTETEHPKEEAEAKAAEEAAARKEEGGKLAKPGPVVVAEKEYSITLPADTFEAGTYGFEVGNAGKIPHDLAVSGPGFRGKTPLIQPGDEAKLQAELGPGRFVLICTVPGHEELGMKTEITVR
jgi:uncharacterized cupredoxin-like copper-binding protein